jgi:hypothetical protein
MFVNESEGRLAVRKENIILDMALLLLLSASHSTEVAILTN